MDESGGEFTEKDSEFHKKRAELILGNLGLDIKDLENKRVLDLGSGESSISFHAKDKSTKIVSLDIEPKRKPTLINPNNTESIVKADMEKLPFADNSFDLILAHASGLEEVFSEDAKRTLKKGGEIRQYPMYGAENWFIYYYLWQVEGLNQEEINAKMSKLISDQETYPDYETDEYVDLLDQALQTLSKNQKIEVLENLKGRWEDILDTPLELLIVNPDADEPRGTLIYKKHKQQIP